MTVFAQRLNSTLTSREVRAPTTDPRTKRFDRVGVRAGRGAGKGVGSTEMPTCEVSRRVVACAPCTSTDGEPAAGSEFESVLDRAHRATSGVTRVAGMTHSPKRSTRSARSAPQRDQDSDVIGRPCERTTPPRSMNSLTSAAVFGPEGHGVCRRIARMLSRLVIPAAVQALVRRCLCRNRISRGDRTK